MTILAPVAKANGKPLVDSSASDAFVKAEMRAKHIPGVSVAIVRDDGILYQNGFGVANPDGKKVTLQTDRRRL